MGYCRTPLRHRGSSILGRWAEGRVWKYLPDSAQLPTLMANSSARRTTGWMDLDHCAVGRAVPSDGLCRRTGCAVGRAASSDSLCHRTRTEIMSTVADGRISQARPEYRTHTPVILPPPTGKRLVDQLLRSQREYERSMIRYPAHTHTMLTSCSRYPPDRARNPKKPAAGAGGPTPIPAGNHRGFGWSRNDQQGQLPGRMSASSKYLGVLPG